MIYALFFFVELLTLFLLSRKLTRTISLTVYRMTHSKKATIYTIAFLFFPGTLIHELAHAITAGVLGVRVGHMEFFPQIEGEKVKLGSVQVGQTDPIRRFLIGAAPFFVGTSLLLAVLYYAAQNDLFSNYWAVAIIGYVVFEIGNTMFSSSKDMEGALEFLGVVVIIAIILFGIGLRLPDIRPEVIFGNPMVETVFKQGSLFLLAPLVLDLIVILLLHPRKR